MRQVMVRYRVKAERIEENEALVRAVYDVLRRTEPAGRRYATFKLDDGVSFQEFQKEIEDRADEGPVVTELDRIGSFRLVGDSREH